MKKYLQLHAISFCCFRLNKILSYIKYAFFPLLLVACGPDNGAVPSGSVYYLEAFEVQGYDIEFDKNRLGVYELEVDETVSQIHIDAKSENSNIEITVKINNEKVDDEMVFANTVNADFDVEEGENYFSLVLSDEEENTTIYRLNIYKVRSSANISAIALYDFISTSDEIALSPIFSSDVFSYELSIPFATCSFASIALTDRYESSLAINGESVKSGETTYHNLYQGENTFDYVVTSENEVYSQQYTVVVNRLSASDETLVSYTGLENIEIRDVDFDFVCGINEYSVVLDKSISRFPINVKPVVDGVSIYINDREVTAEEPYYLEVNDDAGTFVVSVTSLNGYSTGQYTFHYTRYARNRIEVDTVEELQQALKNAEPNDEIIVAKGTYKGDIGLEKSGDENSHFYSNRSGTPNEYIYLVAEEEGVIFSGDSIMNHSALTLDGSYWSVSGIEFSSAAQGVQIRGGHDNSLRNLTLDNLGVSGVSITSGGYRNTVALNEFSNIGGAFTAGNEEGNVQRESLAGVNVGDSPLVNNQQNTIRHNTFLSLGNARAIKVAAGSEDTHIEYNAFLEQKQRGDGERDSLIMNQGNDTLFRFNYFEYSVAPELQSVIRLLPLTEEFSEDSWGENAMLYQNAFDLEDGDFTQVSAEGVQQATVAQNIRYDEGEVMYSGAAIYTDESIVPVYRIQLARDTARCLAVAYVEASGDVEAYYQVEVAICGDTPAFQWRLNVDNGPYVSIENLSIDEDGFMQTVSSFAESCVVGQGIVYVEEDIQGYNQRWLLDEYQGYYFIRNKKNLAYGLSVPGSTYSNGIPVSNCALTGADNQRFLLQRIN
ncbi:hypothetical protein TDB9533_00916 [Thalassocella blandensis]|nr:hypothetical protein TDB9533_00916 [Thalassocella blandensis]